jgi:spore coat polysaccharide biosynthesis predicted glycosyltransferase SpsG
MLLGAQYALLRPEFLALREDSLERRQQQMNLDRLLISMGGVDRGNATGFVLNALNGSVLPENCEITIVTGRHAPWLESIRQQALSMAWKTEVRVGVSDMARLMAESDLAIGAAGATSWERCCLGLPALIMVLAENQQANVRALEKAGAAIWVKDQDDIRNQIAATVSKATNSRPVLHALSVAASRVTDGTGTQSVIACMES